MKTTQYLASDLLNALPTHPSALWAVPLNAGNLPREELRHILLGSPGAIRQTIHQLHVLNYAESVLWSPIMTVGERLVITPEQGEAMSLLRRSL
jgi:hypothetical protein